jgi:hypothetical protein
LVAGCTPHAGGSHDPDKTLLYVHVITADVAFLAGDSLQAGEHWEGLADEVRDMQVAAKSLPAGEPRARKLDVLLDEEAHTVAEFEKAMPEVATGYAAARSFRERTPQLSARWEEVIRSMGEAGAPLAQIQIANRQLLLVERMSRRVDEVMAGGDGGINAADSLSRDLEVYRQVLEAMQSGNAELGIERAASANSQAALASLKPLQKAHAADAEAVIQRYESAANAREAANRLRVIRNELLEAAPPAY